MKIRKIIAMVSAIAVSALLLPACGTTSEPGGQTTPAPSPTAPQSQSDVAAPAEKDDIKITFVSPLVTSPYFITMENGVKAAAKELGVTVECVGTTTVDMNKWMEFIDAAVANESDGIITMTLNEAAIAPAIEKAAHKGIPVVLVDTDAPGTQRTSYYGTNNKEAGRVLGENLARLTGGKAKIGLVTGALDQPNFNERVDGFKEGIAEYPDMEIVDFQVDDSDMAKCIEKTEAMLTAYPEIDALVGCETFCVPGFSRVVSERGLKGKITVVGFDDNEDTIAAIKDGTAGGTIVQRQYLMGYESVKGCLDAINGVEGPEVVDTGVVFLDSGNIGAYNPESIGD